MISDPFPTNDIMSQVSDSNRGSTSSIRNETEGRSVVIYDHIRNLVTNTLVADLLPEENLKIALFNINKGNHSIINKGH